MSEYVEPQPVIVVRSQVERAQADAASAWRSAAAISVILLFTVVLAWGIPFVLAATGIANGRRMRDARAGHYDDSPVASEDQRAATRWTLATLIALIALGAVAIAIRGGSLAVLASAVVFAALAAAVAPWHELRR